MLALIHVFLDNARYHHAKLVREWLAQRNKTPSDCTSSHVAQTNRAALQTSCTETSHNKCYATCAQFADATASFCVKRFRGWADLCDSVTDLPRHQQRILGRDVEQVIAVATHQASSLDCMDTSFAWMLIAPLLPKKTPR